MVPNLEKETKICYIVHSYRYVCSFENNWFEDMILIPVVVQILRGIFGNIVFVDFVQ